MILLNFTIVKVAHLLCQKGRTLFNFAIVKVALIVCQKGLAAFYCTVHARAGATLILSKLPPFCFVRFPPVFTVFCPDIHKHRSFLGPGEAITVMPVETPKSGSS